MLKNYVTNELSLWAERAWESLYSCTWMWLWLCGLLFSVTEATTWYDMWIITVSKSLTRNKALLTQVPITGTMGQTGTDHISGKVFPSHLGLTWSYNPRWACVTTKIWRYYEIKTTSRSAAWTWAVILTTTPVYSPNVANTRRFENWDVSGVCKVVTAQERWLGLLRVHCNINSCLRSFPFFVHNICIEVEVLPFVLW